MPESKSNYFALVDTFVVHLQIAMWKFVILEK